MNDDGIWLVYDGECPICSMSARLIKIKQSVGAFHVINARTPHPILEEIKQHQLDLNEGLIVKYQGNFYHGPDALHLLAMIGSDQDWFNRLNVRLFSRSKWLAKIVYPVMKTLRNIALFLKGKSRL
ncbi:DCC1-like thiol-disulfide oxidoreductase family protein [Candidatus Berkiella aquae]|uniref:DUF393 domain-containing protein n=1 Tax=Candidatus Berkiella aquae TaxID=295108 RepID=A0A0Q9YLQ2_9GAMM|nr:DCC1-like thiol-disulfide oxidoreductase family protein [Candidatus Berkiella aquae]MCS5711582.1 DUF393 domain-containing protein [Candidatus Berkiella aquae]